ncbi:MULTISPECIES: aldose 1-epimerase family protein [Oscillospiraceae]|uniref:aldose 1-epimerase family protein n=1 Tax=Oscillospiraceae TaxID=216572 RepID=UPI0011066986|nr:MULTISPECIES: aldose 1-epimerase family protein [Oscillospiraceae]
MFCLKNEELTLEIASHGAEMRSLKDNQTGQEYLWDADPAFWKRTSPVLFPLVGNYRDKESIYEGKTYSMSQHGFARDMDFTVTEEAENEIWFELHETPETKEKYPFDFCLSIGYRLEGRSVKVMWKVENTNEKTMYFSIGGHPAFVCPISGKGKQTDYRLRFDAEGPVVSSLIGEGGLLTEEKAEYQLENGEMQIAEDLFSRDALVIENDQAHNVALVDPEGNAYVTVEFDAPLFRIWAPKGGKAPFVCIEPWYGRCDRADFSKKLEEREWGNMLEPGRIFEKSYTITVG